MHKHTLQYMSINFKFSYMHDIVCAQKWTSMEKTIDFPTAAAEHLLFPASTACNMRPQVFLYPQQSILLSHGRDRACLRTCLLRHTTLHTPHALQKSFQRNKKTYLTQDLANLITARRVSVTTER